MPREAARRKRTNTLAKAAGPATRLSRPNSPLEMYRRAEKHETTCRNFDPHTSRLLRRFSTLERPPLQCRHGPMTNAVTGPAKSRTYSAHGTLCRQIAMPRPGRMLAVGLAARAATSSATPVRGILTCRGLRLLQHTQGFAQQCRAMQVILVHTQATGAGNVRQKP